MPKYRGLRRVHEQRVHELGRIATIAALVSSTDGTEQPLLPSLHDANLLHVIQLKQCRHGPTIHQELLRLGATPQVARQMAANSRCWWCNSGKAINSVLTISWFDKMGLPRLS